MKKKFTFCSLNPQMRLLGLLTLFLVCTNAFSQTICRPVSQTNSTGGGLLCIGVDVNSPANAFDSAGLSTYATLSNGVAVAGCFAEETMTLSQTARAGDQVAIYFGTGNGLLDLTLLSNATVQAKNSGANVGSSVALNSPLLNLNLLSGNTVAVAKFPITGDTNQIQIQVGGGLVALLATLRVYDVRLEFAQPTVSGGLSQTICAGVPTTLTATPAAGTTLAWYSSEFSTTALAVGNTYTTPALTANTTYYIGITRAAGCEGNVRVPVVLNVSNPIIPAVSNVGTTVCSTGATQQTTLSVVNAAPGTTYNWYSSSTGGPILSSGTTYSPTVPLGTTQFFVEAAIGSCVSSRTSVSVTSTAIPATPTILTQSVTIQSGQNATLSATGDVGTQLNWYETATGGTAVATNTSTFTTPILTATKTYYVEAQSANGNCVSATRVPVTVTVQPAALGGCLEASSQVTSQVGICLLCSATNLSNSVDGNPGTAASLSVPVGVAASIQQTLQFTNPGKAGDIVDVDLELPGGLADLSLLGAVSLATYNGTIYNNDRVAITNPLINLQLLSGNRFRASVTAGANFDRVEIRLGAVATVLSTLNIYQATYRYKAPVVTGNTAICSGTTTTLTAALAVGETVKWYNVATGGTSLASTAAFTTPALTTPTTYYLEVTRNGCVNSVRSSVQVLIDNPVLPTITASPSTICSGQSTTLSVDAPVAGTDYNWYDAPTGGNLVFTGTTFTTPALTADVTYHVEAVIGSCSITTRTAVPLTVNPLPATPTFASSDVLIQSGQTVTLQVQNPVGGVRYNWYDAATGGASVAFNTTSFTPSPALIANKTYYVEASNVLTDCANPVRGIINVTVINAISNCLRANSQVVTKGGLTGCLSCGSVNDGNSIDSDNTTAATLSVPLGVVDYIQQTLTFTSSGQAGDIIDVELGIPTGLLDISALSNISLESFNGGNPNGDQTNISSLLNVQLLGGNRFRASLVAAGAFTSVQIRLTGLLTALSSLDIYDASYRFANATITGAATPICEGQTASLSASSTGGETFVWYDASTGGNIVSVAPTAPLTTTTTYYLEATRGGTCVNSLRQAVTVNVLPIPTGANINIATPIEATCAGVAVIAPTTTIAGATFKYYTDQTKAQEIVNGTTIGTATFAKDANGVLTISGLTGTTHNYYISAVNGGTCENGAGDLKLVTVNLPSVTPLTVIPTPLQACGSANLANAITNFDSTVTYTFYDPSNNVMTADAAANVTVSGTYSIQAQSTTSTCPSAKQSVTVTINQVPTLVVTNPQESVNVGTDVALNATSTGTITWFNPQGVALTGPPFTTGPLNVPGVYTYTAVATIGTCTTTATKIINVIDLTSCQNLTERVYATTQTKGSIITGDVTNGTNAVDGNPQTFSTITTGLGLLGVGTTWQNLTWSSTIAKGTPVTVKLGSEYSLLAVGQNLSVVGTKNGNLIGAMQPVSGSLLNLISGDNTYEFTFVPSDASGPQDYDGIRIVSSSVLSVAQSTKVFDAHYNKPVTSVTCTPGDIQDIFYGATDINLPVGAATALIGVSDAWNVADNDVTTFATMYSGVGVAAAADLTVQFKTPSVLSDTLRIVVSKPGALLTVNLLTGFSVQRYLGNVAVGAPIQNTSQLLSIKLLPGNSLAMVLVSSPTEIYDRVRIRLGGVVGVLDFLRVHTVERTANTTVIGADPQNKITVCPGTDITLQIPEVACSTYRWYDAQTGGNLVASGPTFTVPDNLTAGIYRYYVQPVRYGCESYARGEVTVEVKGTAPVNALANITLNGGTATSICSASGSVTLATGLTGTPALTNPVYHWYKLNGSTTDLVTGETTAQLIVNGLIPGTYTYFVGVSSDELCETAAADRKQITFTILPPSTVNDILVDDVTVCPGLSASLTPTAPTLSSPLFTWYLDANKTQPITNGAVIAGVTYTINAAGILTAAGLTKAVSPITYYVAVSSTNTCENLAGTLQHAAIIVSDPNTPTTTNMTQNFCLSSASTVANIQVNESNVIWYDAATGGNAFASTDLLTGRIYYGAATDVLTSCESSVRLAVTVNVNDPGTPTLVTAGTQNFCTVNAPTFASVQFNESNIVWYTALTGGTLIPSTTALTTGTYYAAIKDATTNCESNTRLPVAVNVTDPATPTTTQSTQNFCLSSASTVANIQVNESNVVWYDADTGGNLFASTDALVSRIYYGAIKDPITDCESSVRLEVTVIVNDPGTPTLVTAGTQNFCTVNAPTFASIQFNESNIVWYTAATGGTLIAPTTALTSGTYYAAINDLTTNCESATRLLVAVNVTDPATPTTTDTTQDFCLSAAATVANIQVNESNVVWYDAATGGTAFASTDLLTGRIYYGAIKDPVTDCESLVRLAVTVNLNDPGTPTLVTTGTQNFCKVNGPTFASVQFNESNIVWYTALTGGTLISSATALTSGTYYAAIKDLTTNCESATRLPVDVIVTDPATPTTTQSTQNFCLSSASTVANIQVNESNVVWYDAATGGNAFASTDALTGRIYYGAIKDPVTDCESSVRLAVTVNVNDPGTPTLVTAGTQNFCTVNAPTFASVQFNESNIVWYTALTGGTLIPSVTALTSGTYYAAIKDLTTNCESATRLPVAVNVTDPATPTTTQSTQNFCLSAAATVANIQVNESNVVWYDAATAGNLFASTDALVSRIYYGAVKDPVTGCESSIRLAVTVNVNDPGTPTLVTAGTQNFCKEDQPTFASIQTNQTNIVWYTALTGGTAIAPTAVLTTGQYFAAISDPTTGCESAVRLAVNVNVSDPGTPTLVTAGTQNFCTVNAQTFASVQFNEANIVWYTATTGGTLIAPTTALTSGTYYAAIKDAATNCESATRLSVNVIVTDPATPTTTDATQNFCLSAAAAVANIQVNESNVVWYDAATAGNLFASTDALVSRIYYGAVKDPVTGCESSVRLAVTVIVNDPGIPTLVTAGTQNFCKEDQPTFASIQTNQTNIVWYTALTGGTAIAPTAVLTTGQYFAAISDPTTGCESAVRLTVNVNVSDPGTPTLVTAGTQNFCTVNAPTFASVQFNESNIVWYTALTGGTLIAPTTVLTSGTYYAAIKDAATSCESATRLSVAVNVTDPATPTTNAAAQTFCTGTNPTVANIQVNESNVVWYATQTGGTAFASTDALTTRTYFGAIKDPTTGCESSVRLQVAVTVGNTLNPTTNNTAQTFCSVNGPTVESIQVNESNVTWFTAATGGTAIPAGTLLASGIYYGNIVDPSGCESSTRLQVTVTVNNPSSTPTTNDTTQNFCTLNSPTVANIQVNEANVVWYSTATGGTAIPPATALETGTYYGAVSSANGCENPVRLAVIVNVNSPSVITTPRTTQTFCLSAIPTLANIFVNEANVVWYASATGGTPLANTTPLTATTYYAGALANTFNGCDNGPRLGVTIAFENDAAVQITSTDDTPCVFKGVTYSIANGKSNYVWTINGGTIISGGGTNDGSVTVSWSDIGPGTVTVAYVNNCDERTIKTLNVTVASCSDLTITHTVDNPTPNFGDQVTFTITVNNVGEGDFINTIVSDLLPSGLQLVSSSATAGTYDPATQVWTIPSLNAGQSVVLTVVAEVLPSGNYTSVATIEISTPLDVDTSNNSASVTLVPICLTVYNEFTPNNDGKNDLFRIDCIESHPNNELKVFNRYGALVYSKTHYENDWDGTANVSGVVNRGDMLPTGTYFYVITIGDGTVKKGWLSIMR
ncbi:gliding motility-associated C-terminal domain-containing protein [Flavobacterium sp. UBA4854]|uniref:Ig-like domain-containing protein n=1 Tax=Flavobacterium sp. UBA4854 TaxID=1946548 RepID=UPI00257B0D1F|nr:gliding motility-associated C-terminal domain-containing protein [Flavobacterium sp. UBA4854]